MDDVRRTRAVSLMSAGGITAAVLLLAFAAFDDITTDNASDFRLEYGLLAVCAVWLLVLAFRLIRDSRLVLGGLSVGVLASALWAQSAIHARMTPGFWPAYVVMLTAFLWFLVIAVVIFVVGWRAHPERDMQRP